MQKTIHDVYEVSTVQTIISRVSGDLNFRTLVTAQKVNCDISRRFQGNFLGLISHQARDPEAVLTLVMTEGDICWGCPV